MDKIFLVLEKHFKRFESKIEFYPRSLYKVCSGDRAQNYFRFTKFEIFTFTFMFLINFCNWNRFFYPLMEPE